jgi:hypothetical protein
LYNKTNPQKKIAMKKVHTLCAAISMLLFVLLQTTARAQQQKPWQIRRAYLSANAGTSTGFAFTTHFNNRWTAQFATQGKEVKAKNLPDAFVPYVVTPWFFGDPYTYYGPKDSYKAYTLSVGRVLNKTSDKAWVMAMAGITYCKYAANEFVKLEDQALNNPNPYGYQRLDNNYVYKKADETGIGATIGMQATINLFRFMGLEAGSNLMITTAAVKPNVWLGLNVGLMRPAKKQ